MEKAFYALDEAANIMDCAPRDLLHLASRDEIVLLAGVPDGICFQIYDAGTDQVEPPALLEPQLLALSAQQCQKLEIVGRTEQTDFRVGYKIRETGTLQVLKPSYGKAGRLNHGWAFWRTYRGPNIKEIELTLERLFVVGEDVHRLLATKAQPISTIKTPKRLASGNLVQAECVTPDDGIGENPHVDNPSPEVRQEITAERNSISQISATPSHGHPITFLRLTEVRKRTGLSRSAIYDKLDIKSPRHDPTFPKQRSLGAGSVAWIEAEVEAWLASRKEVTK